MKRIAAISFLCGLPLILSSVFYIIAEHTDRVWVVDGYYAVNNYYAVSIGLVLFAVVVAVLFYIIEDRSKPVRR